MRSEVTRAWIERMLLVDLCAVRNLDQIDCRDGMHSAHAGDGEPDHRWSLSYWHGWRMGAIDKGMREPDPAVRNMVRQKAQERR